MLLDRLLNLYKHYNLSKHYNSIEHITGNVARKEIVGVGRYATERKKVVDLGIADFAKSSDIAAEAGIDANLQ